MLVQLGSLSLDDNDVEVVSGFMGWWAGLSDPLKLEVLLSGMALMKQPSETRGDRPEHTPFEPPCVQEPPNPKPGNHYNFNSCVTGRVGEERIIRALCDRFPSAHVERKGGGVESRAQDVWLHVSDHVVVAFESKNKAVVTKGDVDKFYRDLMSMPTCAGAVFVSLASPSIPGKGCIFIEVFDSRPVMFVAYDGVEDFERHFRAHTYMFIRLVEMKLKYTTADSVDEKMLKDVNDRLERVVRQVSPLVEKLGKWTTNLARLARNAKESWKLVESMQESAVEMRNRIEDVLVHESIAASEQVTATALPSCMICGRGFKTQRGLKTHSLSCQKSMAKIPSQ